MYADEGKTGTSTKRRTEFNRMMADARAGKIDIIITKSISRFARNTVDCLNSIRELKALGVKVIFEKENIDTMDIKGDLMITLLSSIAEEESRSISTNIRWSVQKRFERGEVIMCFNNLLGYSQKEDGRVEILPHEAETVRDIYNMFLDGFSLQAIKAELENREVLSPRGKTGWSVSTLHSILRNEKYIGDALLQKTYSADFLNNKRRINDGRLKQKYVQNNHPAIISRETFSAAQAEIERRKSLRSATASGKGKYTGKYAFSGMLTCGECGSQLRRHKPREYVWVCINHQLHGNGACRQKAVKEKAIEDAFLQVINNLITDKAGCLKIIMDNISEEIVDAGNGNVNEELEKLELELRGFQEQMLKLNQDRQYQIISSDEYTKNAVALTAQMDAIFIKREKIMSSSERSALGIDQLSRIKEQLNRDAEFSGFDRTIFMNLVSGIKVSAKEFIYELKNGTALSVNI